MDGAQYIARLLFQFFVLFFYDFQAWIKLFNKIFFLNFSQPIYDLFVLMFSL